MSNFWAYLYAVFAGALTNVQVGTNLRLFQGLQSPALTVTGGAIVSLLLDHYGLVGFEQHSLNWSRVAGATLLVAGTVLMAR